MDDIKKDVKSFIDMSLGDSEPLRQVKHNVTSAAETAIDATEDAIRGLRSGIARMEAATTEQAKEARSVGEDLYRDYKAHESVFFAHLKRGVEYGAENPGYMAAGLAAAALVTLRGPRKLLYRATIGRFRSAEADVISAEGRVKGLRANVDLYKNETKKLLERAQLADEEFRRGRSKLLDTGTEMQRLWKAVSKTTHATKGMQDALRDLPARDSIRLRAEVAALAADARQQKLAVERRMANIAKLGLRI